MDTRKLPKFIGKEPKKNVFKSGDKERREEEKKRVYFFPDTSSDLWANTDLMLQAKEQLVKEAGAGKEEHLILEVLQAWEEYYKLL